MDFNKQEVTRKKRKLSNMSMSLDPTATSTSTVDEPQIQLEQGTIWMDDGNVIIQAGRTQFRVHKSMLSRCSSVFKDMFSLPRPSDVCESLLEGCQVVHLHDAAEDVEHLLSALYDHRYSADPSSEKEEFRVVSALLRLGNKYDIPLIRSNMMLRIRAELPTCYEDANFEHFIYINLSETGLYVDMANLAHQEGICSALPLALAYVLSKHSIEEILNGVGRDDGTNAVLHPSLMAPCLIGKERLITYMWETSYKWLRDSASGNKTCCSTPTCQAIFSALEKVVFQPPVNPGYTLEMSWEDMMDIESLSGHGLLCTKCNKAAQVHHEKGRNDVYEELPSIFGYKSWDEVKQMDRYEV